MTHEQTRKKIRAAIIALARDHGVVLNDSDAQFVARMAEDKALTLILGSIARPVDPQPKPITGWKNMGPQRRELYCVETTTGKKALINAMLDVGEDHQKQRWIGMSGRLRNNQVFGRFIRAELWQMPRETETSDDYRKTTRDLFRASIEMTAMKPAVSTLGSWRSVVPHQMAAQQTTHVALRTPLPTDNACPFGATTLRDANNNLCWRTDEFNQVISWFSGLLSKKTRMHVLRAESQPQRTLTITDAEGWLRTFHTVVG